MILNYILGYLSFLLGILLYLLAKVSEYKKMAKQNPNPDIRFSMKSFWNDEWINFARVLIAGVALVLFMPMLIGGSMVELKNNEGGVIASFALRAVLIPFYFFVGYSGNSAVFAIFGKYKKTLLNQVGVDDSNG